MSEKDEDELVDVQLEFSPEQYDLLVELSNKYKTTVSELLTALIENRMGDSSHMDKLRENSDDPLDKKYLLLLKEKRALEKEVDEKDKILKDLEEQHRILGGIRKAK